MTIFKGRNGTRFNLVKGKSIYKRISNALAEIFGNKEDFFDDVRDGFKYFWNDLLNSENDGFTDNENNLPEINRAKHPNMTPWGIQNIFHKEKRESEYLLGNSNYFRSLPKEVRSRMMPFVEENDNSRIKVSKVAGERLEGMCGDENYSMGIYYGIKDMTDTFFNGIKMVSDNPINFQNNFLGLLGLARQAAKKFVVSSVHIVKIPKSFLTADGKPILYPGSDGNYLLNEFIVGAIEVEKSGNLGRFVDNPNYREIHDYQDDGLKRWNGEPANPLNVHNIG